MILEAIASVRRVICRGGMSAALFSALIATASAADAKSAPIVFESTDTPPFWSASLPDNGQAGRLLRLMSDAAGVKYSIEYLPVKRFRRSDAPFIVGAPGVFLNVERRAIFPIAIFRSAFFFYKPHQDVIKPGDIKRFSGHTMGVLRGTLEKDKAYFLQNGIRVEESDSIESLLKKLKQGRIDFSILVQESGQYFIKKLFSNEVDHFAAVGIPETVLPIAIMIDKSNPKNLEVVRRYRNVLKTVLHDKKYRAALVEIYGQERIDEVYKQLDKLVKDYQGTWDE